MTAFTISNATEFYRRNETKLIFVMVIICSIYLLTFAAKITWLVLPQPETHNSSQRPQIHQSQSTNDTSNVNNINRLISQNLFGNATAKPKTTQIEEVNDVPETKLNLVLSGVVSSDDSQQGAAIIEYRNLQSTYGIGDKIEGTNVTLDEIYVDRVIIKNRVTRETLMLDGINFDEANQTRTTQSVSATSPQAPTNTSSPATNKQQQARAVRQARQQLSQEPASFTDMISLAPHRVDGVFVGFKVSPGAKPQLFKAVGLKSGDVVIQLNGLDLSDLTQAKEATAQLQQADTLQLEVLRGDEYISLDLDIPESSGNDE